MGNKNFSIAYNFDSLPPQSGGFLRDSDVARAGGAGPVVGSRKPGYSPGTVFTRPKRFIYPELKG